jgi:hypothetical protein
MKTKLLLLTLFTSALSFAQYNSCAGTSEVSETKTVERQIQLDGKTKIVYEKVAVTPKDDFGNVEGNQYDLAVDGAFEGQTILKMPALHWQKKDSPFIDLMEFLIPTN